MAFSIFETSRTRGAPVELFLFRYGIYAEDVYCYTNGEREIEHDGYVYKPVPLKRSKISVATGETGKQALEVNMPGHAEVAQMFRVSAPSSRVSLTVFQGHVRDPDKDFLAVWTGSIKVCQWRQDGNEAKFSCEASRTQLHRLSLRRHYQYMCPLVLYGDQCRASESAATVQMTVHEVVGRFVTLTSALPGPDRFIGGMVKFTDNSGNVRARSIMNHRNEAGKTLLVLSSVDDKVVPGQTVSVVRGCTRNLDGCSSHNNVLNYGGYPYIPTKNPLGLYGAFS